MIEYSPADFLSATPDYASPKFSMSLAVREDFEAFFIDEFDDDKGSSFTDLKPVTKTIKKKFSMKRNYNHTSNELRLKLIEDVHKKGLKIKLAAKLLGINYSSAKAICQIYKREGRIDKKLATNKSVDNSLITEKAKEIVNDATPQEICCQFQKILPEASAQSLYVKQMNNPQSSFPQSTSMPVFLLAPEAQPSYGFAPQMMQVKPQGEMNSQIGHGPLSLPYQSQMIYLIPHNSNMMRNRTNGCPVLINPVFYMPTQNINMALTSFPQMRSSGPQTQFSCNQAS